jgi:hypothetical protein
VHALSVYAYRHPDHADTFIAALVYQYTRPPAPLFQHLHLAPSPVGLGPFTLEQQRAAVRNYRGCPDVALLNYRNYCALLGSVSVSFETYLLTHLRVFYPGLSADELEMASALSAEWVGNLHDLVDVARDLSATAPV